MPDCACGSAIVLLRSEKEGPRPTQCATCRCGVGPLPRLIGDVPQPDSCGASGKVCYASVLLAQRARKHAPSGKRKLDVYFCPHCRHFHLGSPRQGAQGTRSR